MSFRDAAPEKTTLQSDTFRGVVMPVMFFGVLAFVIWSLGQFLWSAGETGMKTMATVIKPGGGSVPVPHDVAAQAPVAPVPRRHSDEPEPEQAPAIVSIMEAPRPKRKAVSEWKMRGVIYDLITLEPIPGVHMIFTDNATNSSAHILSEASGRYRAILPALRGHGYLVSLSKTGYEKTYLNPGTEGVREIPLEDRKQLVRELSTLIAEPASLEPNSETALVTDFHMAPK